MKSREGEEREKGTDPRGSVEERGRKRKVRGRQRQ